MLQNFVANKQQRQDYAAALLHAKTCQTVRQLNLFVVKWKFFSDNFGVGSFSASSFSRDDIGVDLINRVDLTDQWSSG